MQRNDCLRKPVRFAEANVTTADLLAQRADLRSRYDPGMLAHHTLTAVAGLKVGHCTRTERPTGCTVVVCEHGAVAGVDVRGGAPGTRETDLLRPENTIEQVHAVLLTGGSAFGLDAATGVMRWLEEQSVGVSVGPARVPIVPAAVLFDLWVGDARIRPDAAAGYAAAQAASTQAVPQGNVGAGAGAAVGKLLGIDRAMRGGLGSAAIKVGGITVAALMAVNAVGDVLDEHGQVMAGARTADGAGLANVTQLLMQGVGPARLMHPMVGSATTIGVVATDALLTKAQACKLASLGQHGLSRAISPITPHDGDTLFALSTGHSGLQGELTLLGAMAAEVVAQAIRNAVRAASTLHTPLHLPSAADLFALKG
jgi:L-aminopeptidase/D-esterase-like protein